MTNSLDEKTITKKTSLSEENPKIFHNDTTDNQDSFIQSDILKFHHLKSLLQQEN